jgi:hypothetical protein
MSATDRDPPAPGRAEAWKRRRVEALLAAIGLAAALAAGVATSGHGPGVTPDSVVYLSVAESLGRGEGFLQFDGGPYLLWPPLYPALLALLSPVASPLAAARLLNLALLAAIVFLAGNWTRRVCGDAAGLVAALGVALSPAAAMACMVFSEPLFILLTLAALLALAGYRSRPRTRTLLAAALFTALAALTRYLGMSLILAGAILILARRREPPKIGTAAIFVSIAGLPLGLWLGRNYLLCGSLMGPRYPSATGMAAGAVQVLEVLNRWFLRSANPAWQVLPVLVPLLAVAGFFLLATGNRERKNFALVNLVFAGVYAAWLVLSASRVAFDPIGGRLLAPLFVPLWLTTIGGLFAARGRTGRPGVRHAADLLILLLAARMAWGSFRLGMEIRSGGPGGYGREPWRGSETAAYARTHPLPPPIFSNEPYALFFLAGKASNPSPCRHPYNSPAGPPSDPRPFRSAAGGTVVLFNFHEPRFLAAAALDRMAPLTETARLADGAVYRIGPPP